MNERPGPSHFGEAVQEAVEARAERVVVAALGRLGWTEEDLKRRLKGDPGKIEIARELRSKTTLPLAWIAQRLCMGTRNHLAWLVSASYRGEGLAGAMPWVVSRRPGSGFCACN